MIRGTCLGFNWHQLFLLSYVEQWKESQKKMSYFHFPCGAGQKTELLVILIETLKNIFHNIDQNIIAWNYVSSDIEVV